MNFFARFVGGLLERVVALVFAVVLAQFPVYFAAYNNTLAGARLEAEARYIELQTEAAKLNLSVQDFIVHHETNADAVFQASGRIHRATLERYTRYMGMTQALEAAPVWQRPLALARNYDKEISRATQFTPGLPMSLEGLGYAFAGLLLGWIVTAFVGFVSFGGRRRSGNYLEARR